MVVKTKEIDSKKLIKEMKSIIDFLNIRGLIIDKNTIIIENNICRAKSTFGDVILDFIYNPNNEFGDKELSFIGNNKKYTQGFAKFSDLTQVQTILCQNFFNDKFNSN